MIGNVSHSSTFRQWFTSSFFVMVHEMSVWLINKCMIKLRLSLNLYRDVIENFILLIQFVLYFYDKTM